MLCSAGPSYQGLADGGDADSDADLQAAIRASLMTGNESLESGSAAGGGSSSSPGSRPQAAPSPLQLGSAADAAAMLLEEDEDRDLAAAIAASLAHEGDGREGMDSGSDRNADEDYADYAEGATASSPQVCVNGSKPTAACETRERKQTCFVDMQSCVGQKSHTDKQV